MAKMKLVTDDINTLADAIARRLAHTILEGLEKDPNEGRCPNCGKGAFIDYCFGCQFVPFWERRESK
jgi:hypothetical protein